VYVVANMAESLEDLPWLRQEIEADGGSATIAAVSFLEGIADEEIEAMVGAERLVRPVRAPVSCNRRRGGRSAAGPGRPGAWGPGERKELPARNRAPY
jgi:hypothetical protein